MASSSKGFLNLTLDEIIQRKKKAGNGQGPSFQGRNKSKTFLQKNLRTSLSGRLGISRNGKRGRGFKKDNFDIQRNGAITRKLAVQGGKQKGSVHSRLSIKPQNSFDLNRGSVQKYSIRTKDLKSKNSEDSLPVRITNGAIVKGLRSDQLLLRQINQQRNHNLQTKIERLRARQTKRSHIVENNLRRETWKKSSKVAMNIDRGLTISIANEVARKARRPPSKAQRYPSPSNTSSSSSDESYPAPSSSRRPLEATKDPVSSILRLGLERPPPPKPHRQVLDPVVQKEIAALQGYSEPHTVGPGPGVKGFKMMPNRSKHSLNERFTIEKTLND